jgi:hypothetical protein
MLELPKPISVAAFAPPVGEKTYTQHLQETIGNLGDSTDGWDAAFASAANALAAMGAPELQAGIQNSLAAAAQATAGLDPATLDGHVADYVASKPYSDSLVSAAAAGKVPNLLEMPITPDGGFIQFEPPTLAAHDFGTLKLGSAPISMQIGTTISTVLGGDKGMVSANIVNQDPVEWEITQTERDTNNGDRHITTYLTVSPLVIGKGLCQVKILTFTPSKVEILTATVNVVA